MQKHQDVIIGTDGLPIAGAQVTVYQAGTVTKASIYEDDGITPATNPITTDARGRFAFYAADGLYDIQAEMTGYGSSTQSAVQVDAQDTAGSIAFTPASGLTATNVQAAIEELAGQIAAMDVRVTALETP